MLRAPRLWRDVAFDCLGRFWFRHTLPTNNLETRTAIEPHHDVFIASAIGLSRRFELARVDPLLGRERPCLLQPASWRLQHVVGHHVARFNPAFSAVFIMSLYPKPSFFLGIVGRILNILKLQDINDVAAINFQQIGSNYRGRTTNLGASRHDDAGVISLRQRAAACHKPSDIAIRSNLKNIFRQ